MNSYPQQSFSPDDENRGSIVDTLGKIALGAGTLAAGVAGYRRLKGLDTKTGRRVNTISEEDLRKPATTKTSPGDPRYDNVRRAAQGIPNITTGAVDPAPAPLSSLERYRNLEKLTRTARDERMPGTMADLSKIAQTSASAAAGLSAVPQVAKPARQTPRVSSGPEQIVPQGEFNTIEIPDQVDRVIDSLGQELELNRQQRIVRGIEGREIGLGKNILAGFRREAREEAEAAKNTPAKTFLASKLASEGYIDTAVTRQQANAPQVSLQSAEAVDTGIDQAVQRNKVAAQRDHDRDLSQLEVLEDIAEQNEQLMRREATPDQMIGYEPDAAVKSAIAQQPGGALRDQTDTSLGQSSAARFLASERDEIASQLGEQGLAITPGRVDRELANRLGADAYLYGPKYTQRKQALQLGATYDPALFENMAKPSVRVAGEEVPTGRVSGIEVERTPYTNTPIAEDVELGLRQPTYMKETAERLQERAANKRDFLGRVRLEEASKSAKLNTELINTNRQYNQTLDYSKELTDFLDSKTGSPEQRTRARQRLDDINYELDRLDARSEELNQLVYGGQSGARVRGAEKFTENYIANLTPPPRLKPGVEEGQRIAYQIDPLTNQPLAGTAKIVPERKMVDMTPKGGGGRNVAEFSAGTRDEGIDVDLENILQQQRTPRDQSAREYEKDQLGYRPGTGLTGKALEGQSFTDDRTQTGRTITRAGIELDAPQAGTMEGAVNPYSQLDNETLGMMSLMGGEADAANASRMLARRQREGYDPGSITGPGSSNRVVVSQEPTPQGRRSMDVSDDISRIYKTNPPERAQSLVAKYLRGLQSI